MSFENYGQYQNTGAQDGAPGQIPPPQDGAMSGQPVDPSQANQYVAQGNGNNDGAGPGGDQKTTLWYDGAGCHSRGPKLTIT